MATKLHDLPIPPPDREWLRKEQAAGLLGYSLSTFDRRVAKGDLPKPFRNGARTPLWRRDELIAAVELTRNEQGAA
jgi:predicted DNA-binding transcriptional regulator AlpA